MPAGSFDLYYGEVRLTADWNLAPLLATGGRLNYGGWSDARCDQLLEAARSALDQKAALSTLCRYLLLQTPILPVCFKSVSVLYAANTVLRPFPPLPLNRFTNFRTSQFSFGTADVKDSLRDISACFCYAVAEVRHDA